MSRNLPVPYTGAGSQQAQSAAPRAKPRVGAGYAAQLLGQDGQKRGLKGGAPVLDAARSAYLEAEYTGLGDRRLPAGILRRTAV